jgi:ribosomal peptide maturation radical SAM protein 1
VNASHDGDVLLVSMPFANADRPSIQLGLLKAVATSHGFRAESFHAQLHLAEQIGVELYHQVGESSAWLLGDWLFSPAAFPDAPDVDDRLLDLLEGNIREPGRTRSLISQLRRLREVEVPRFLAGLLSLQPWDRYPVVAFTSTFQQTVASIALARELKQRHPSVTIVFGGANLEGDMGREILRSTPVIDHVVSGEGDEAFPALLDALSGGHDPAEVPGVLSRGPDGAVRGDVAPPVVHLDRSPVPDYGEYFDRAERLGLLRASGHRRVHIPFESSRGCWWGQKHHCTFCGLNGTAMSYRKKSPERVVEELSTLAHRYRSFSFLAVDNILDNEHLRLLLPALLEQEWDFELFYEVKANLTREQLRDICRAGVTRVQPGIESLSSRVLGLMKKGVTAAQNINTLRWAHYYGMDVAWNMLWGFPGEEEIDYKQQAALIGGICHLPPPEGACRISLERFSPLFDDRAKYPLRRISPGFAYSYVYPAGVDLDRVAYFFDYELEGTLPDTAFEELEEGIRRWQRSWDDPASRPRLTYWSAPGFVHIHDQRWDREVGTYRFPEPLASIYRACSDRPRSADSLRESLDLGLSVAEVQEVLDEFAARSLMFLDGRRALSLALPAVRNR